MEKNMFFVIAEMPSKLLLWFKKKLPDHFNEMVIPLWLCTEWGVPLKIGFIEKTGLIEMQTNALKVHTNFDEWGAHPIGAQPYLRDHFIW